MTDKHDKLVEMALASGAQYHVTTDPGVWLELDAEALAAFAAAHVASLCADVEPVRMLTQPELNDVALSEKVGWGPGEYVEAVQRAFCRINAGKRIPADGEVR